MLKRLACLAAVALAGCAPNLPVRHLSPPVVDMDCPPLRVTLAGKPLVQNGTRAWLFHHLQTSDYLETLTVWVYFADQPGGNLTGTLSVGYDGNNQPGVFFGRTIDENAHIEGPLVTLRGTKFEEDRRVFLCVGPGGVDLDVGRLEVSGRIEAVIEHTSLQGVNQK